MKHKKNAKKRASRKSCALECTEAQGVHFALKRAFFALLTTMIGRIYNSPKYLFSNRIHDPR